MPELKIVSYNIDHSTRVEAIADNIVELAKQSVNIFCLQEVRPPKSGEFIGDRLLRELGPDWKAEFFLTPKPFNSDYGLGFFWKTTEIQAEKFETVSFSKLARLDLHEQALEIARGSDNHPIQRGALIGNFIINGKPIRISNLHIDWHGWAQHRSGQLEDLLKHLRKNPADTELLCGDFNTIGFFGFGKRFGRIESMLQGEFKNVFSKFQITTTHFQELDHIFVKNMKINQAKVFELPGSDHYPIMAVLDF